MDSQGRLYLHPETIGGGGAGGGTVPGVAPGVIPTAKPPNLSPVGPGVAPTVKPPNAVAAPPAGAGAAGEVKQKITHIRDMGTASVRHQDNWKRKTNLTGNGATHVRSFHCRLNSESMAIMDDQINKWLDEHQDYEVKLVTSSIGEWQGKIKEPYMIVHVWV